MSLVDDDFADNLATDLAPFLSLVGGNVTTQFLSQCSSKRDICLLALAPLGILTINVASIRLAGYAWPKMLIGRSMEDRVQAESDLTSSTSDQVCELWDGFGIFRTIGQVPVKEYVCLTVPQDHVISDSFMSGVFHESHSRIWGLRADRDLGVEMSTNPKWRYVVHPAKPDHQHNLVVAIRDTEDAPNINLNCNRRHGKTANWLIVATFIIVWGTVAWAPTLGHHPDLQNVNKEDGGVPDWALGLYLAGNALQFLGLFLSGYCIDKMTVEHTYTPKPNVKMSIIWLQEKCSIGDKEFKSYALSPAESSERLLTSRMVRPDEHPTHMRCMRPLAIIGTCTSISGYLLFLFGIRAMHFSVATIFIGTMIISAGVRFFVRRGVVHPPNFEEVLGQVGLDWLAKKLARNELSVQSSPQTNAHEAQALQCQGVRQWTQRFGQRARRRLALNRSSSTTQVTGSTP